MIHAHDRRPATARRRGIFGIVTISRDLTKHGPRISILFLAMSSCNPRRFFAAILLSFVPLAFNLINFPPSGRPTSRLPRFVLANRLSSTRRCSLDRLVALFIISVLPFCPLHGTFTTTARLPSYRCLLGSRDYFPYRDLWGCARCEREHAEMSRSRFALFLLLARFGGYAH